MSGVGDYRTHNNITSASGDLCNLMHCISLRAHRIQQNVIKVCNRCYFRRQCPPAIKSSSFVFIIFSCKPLGTVSTLIYPVCELQTFLASHLHSCHKRYMVRLSLYFHIIRHFVLYWYSTNHGWLPSIWVYLLMSTTCCVLCFSIPVPDIQASRDVYW